MEQWSSRFGFTVAAIGAAVGLGNIWRFPAVVGENGGGAYLVPYLIAALAFAVPLMILEISIGRSLKADVVTACREIRPRFEIVGWLIGGSVLAVLSYYLVITGWVLAFLVFAATGSGTSFEAFTGTYQPIGFFIVSTLVVGVVVSLGVQDGIERMAKVLVPGVFGILIGLAVYVATLPGFVRGLRFFVRPDPAVLGEPLIWSAAFGQVFFSFSVGMGVLLTYGSYLGAETNVTRSSLTIAAADLAVALIAGIVIFGIVFSFDLEPTAGTELAFTTLPTAFETMPFGTGVAVLFFGLLFFAAIAPSVSMLEVGVAGTIRATGWSRRKASIATTAVILVAGLPSALSYSTIELTLFGAPVLDVLDATVGAYGLPLAAVAIVIVFAWYQDAETFRAQLGNAVARGLVKFVVPVVLLSVITLRLGVGIDPAAWAGLPDLARIEGLTAGAVTLAIALVLALVGWAFYRWHRSSGFPSPDAIDSRSRRE